MNLFHRALEVLALDKIWDIILIILLLPFLLLLQVLVTLSELAQGGQAIRAQLVQDAGNKFRELLLLSIAVESKCVRRDGRVNYSMISNYFGSLEESYLSSELPFGFEKWMTLPSSLNMLTSSMAWIG